MSHFKYICAFKGSDNNAPSAGSTNPLKIEQSHAQTPFLCFLKSFYTCIDKIKIAAGILAD